MIHDIENSRYLTDAQWLRLMEIVSGNKEMQLHMPTGENCPIDLTYDNTHYIITADGSYNWTKV